MSTLKQDNVRNDLPFLAKNTNNALRGNKDIHTLYTLQQRGFNSSKSSLDVLNHSGQANTNRTKSVLPLRDLKRLMSPAKPFTKDTRARNRLPQFDQMNKSPQLLPRSDQAGASIETCLSFYEHMNSPIVNPIPVCGSKNYPSHSVHCYRSSISLGTHRSSLLSNGLKFDNAALNVSRTTQAHTLADLGVSCSFQNIAVKSQNVLQSLRDCTRNCDIRGSKSLFLLDNKQLSQCPVPTLTLLMNVTDENDDTRNFVQELLMLNSKQQIPPSRCSQWINKTAFFFIANEPYNIYFQFLTYYNIFVTMNRFISSKLTVPGLKDRKESLDIVLIRLSDATDYRFGKFEQKLFTGVKVLNSFSTSTRNTSKDLTCFRRVIKVPWSYSALPFRSVVDSRLKSETLRCYNASTDDEIGKPHVEDDQDQRIDRQTDERDNVANFVLNLQNGHDKAKRKSFNVVKSMMLFQRHVLQACNIKDHTASVVLDPKSSLGNKLLQPPSLSATRKFRLPLNVVFIKRKPYQRHGQDHPGQFQRVLTNEGELEAAMKQGSYSKMLNVTSLFMEELGVCEQVRVSQRADVIIGVHGAGLVHSWWMKEGGVLFELSPQSKLNWPTYKVLAGLTGKRYYSVSLKDNKQKNHSSVDVLKVMDMFVKIIKELIVT